MKNFVKPGNTLTYTAPSGGVTGGVPVLIGALVVIAAHDAAESEEFEGAAVGVFDLVKATGAWSEGQKIYWDNTAKACTTTITSNTFMGVAAAAALSADATGIVRLNGSAA